MQVGRAVHLELDALLDRARRLLQQVRDAFADRREAQEIPAALRRSGAAAARRSLLLHARASIEPILLVEVLLVAVLGRETPARRFIASHADDLAQEPVVLAFFILVWTGDHRAGRERNGPGRAG